MLSTCKGLIKYSQRLVLLTTPSGERIEYEGIQLAPEEYENDLLESVSCEDNKVDCDFSDVNVEEQNTFGRRYETSIVGSMWT